MSLSGRAHVVGFASTHWSVVLMAGGDGEASEVSEALSRLCSTYWYPVYAFIRRQGHDAHAAEELTQEFFTRFLEKDFLASVDKSRGRFRSFLLACCRHFLANQRDFARAQKRGSGRPALSLDFADAAQRYGREPADLTTAEKLFERRWALTMLDQALDQLKSEYEAQDKGMLFEHLKGALVGGSAAALSYGAMGAALGMTEDAVRKAAQRLRQRYRGVLREHIADTLADPGDVDQEIRDLFAAVGG